MGDPGAMTPVGSAGHVFGAWGPPPDAPAKVALACAAVVALSALAPLGSRRAVDRPRDALFVRLCAFAAAALSLGYVAFYLVDGPRIVDATTYWLQARALSEGHFAWSVPEPSASFRGRFELAHDGAIGGIFPPGYPLLLSMGFALGAPMVVGPALAGAIVFATSALARTLARDAGLDEARVATIGRLAAALSVTCAALRYHTADTMAHGACALAFAIALRSALRARQRGRERDEREEKPWFFLVAGLALGFVAATRFASAIALGAVLAFAAARSRSRVAALLACALGALPGLALLAIAQHVVTGDALRSAQAAYYAASDGPPGCFRYGFGRGIGCFVEHGEFVRAGMLKDGATWFGAKGALFVTGRRLAYHLGDVANLEPLALLALAPLFFSRARAGGARIAAALVGAQVLAYAPFYFDGDYPGGGARFFADVLPVEHALVALGVARLAEHARVAIDRAGAAVIALALAGFAVHAAYGHEALRARDGGRPMFDRESLARAHVPDGALLFVESDHAFALAHDPAAAERAARGRSDARQPAGPIVARLRGDDHDRLLLDRLGRPPAFVHHFRPAKPATLADVAAGPAPEALDAIEPWNATLPAPGGRADSWRFEGEAEWPPLVQRGAAWAEPLWATGTCASDGRALAVRADGAGEVRLDLPIPHPGAWNVAPRVFGLPSTLAGHASLVVGDPELARWDVPSPSALAKDACVDLPAREILSNAPSVPLVLRCETSPCAFALDRTLLSPAHPAPSAPAPRMTR